MQECDPPTAGAGPGLLVHQLIPLAATFLEGAVEVPDPVAYVVNPRSPFGEKTGHGPVGSRGVQELDQGGAEWQRNNGRAVDGFGRMWLEAQDVTIERQRLIEISDRDANVGDLGRRKWI